MKIFNFKIKASAVLMLLYGSCFSVAHAETDQQLMASGQWRDPMTNLVWMRCSIGQQWTGSTCEGEAKPMQGFESIRFAQAIANGSGFAGYTNWRLPTTLELSTIRICNTGWLAQTGTQVANINGTMTSNMGNPKMISLPPPGNYQVPLKCASNAKQPTINNYIFPNTSVEKQRFWWTSQPSGQYDLWIVNFWNGAIADIGGADWKGQLRLVRNQ